MEFIATGFHYLWSFVVILSVIVFIHEFGHYLVAKLCGVKIETFSIGFGREIFGFNDRTGTRWKFSLLPFGGYVKMFGDAGAASTADKDKLDQMSEADKKVSFHYKKLWQKALIVAAGPISNFILTIAVFTYFLYSTGINSTDPIVGEVIPDTPAQSAGLQAGDRILSVNGEETPKFRDIPGKIITNLGEEVDLHIERNGEKMHISLIPMMSEEEDALGNKMQRPLIGIQSQTVKVEDLSFPQAVGHATYRTYDLCVTSLHFIGQMITGDRSARDMKGPIGIAQLSGQVTQQGDTTGETVRTILWFIALLSANLGLINLFPIPMLDGGHLAYYGVEALRGRPMAEKFQEYGFRAGFALILMLMAFTIFNDLRNLVS
ncbi:MAG: RIP metalloprotease RseP [Rickettsiales bacterium]|nr:RIP metalloprotease RseP [Rickettsiales bacterium]|tara:strand:+ start:619 stop:1746 length:1128 start_codon:yes stop_codon:yes gene_type:complete